MTSPIVIYSMKTAIYTRNLVVLRNKFGMFFLVTEMQVKKQKICEWVKQTSKHINKEPKYELSA
jgi:hypothetical protein